MINDSMGVIPSLNKDLNERITPAFSATHDYIREFPDYM